MPVVKKSYVCSLLSLAVLTLSLEALSHVPGPSDLY